MHAILALVQIQDSALDLSAAAGDVLTLTYHWSRAISSVSRKLSQAIIPSEKDAL